MDVGGGSGKAEGSPWTELHLGNPLKGQPNLQGLGEEGSEIGRRLLLDPLSQRGQGAFQESDAAGSGDLDPSDSVADQTQRDRLGGHLVDDAGTRWDGASVHEWAGTYGDYLTAKVAKVFPDLAG
ncbi:MAG: hypothetical protein BWY99_02915 [Synergistetes bacterium ADurb.BinA166]|nr:MAG: hypothetical protein BWY99_02915 [Synergistetes bacterium ADurb.BinA166]